MVPTEVQHHCFQGAQVRLRSMVICTRSQLWPDEPPKTFLGARVTTYLTSFSINYRAARQLQPIKMTIHPTAKIGDQLGEVGWGTAALTCPNLQTELQLKTPWWLLAQPIPIKTLSKSRVLWRLRSTVCNAS